MKCARDHTKPSRRGPVTNATFKHYGNSGTEPTAHRKTKGAGLPGAAALRNSRGPRRLRDRVSSRPRLRTVIVCGLLVTASIPVALPRFRLEGNPRPPTQAQVNAAENRVKQQ